MGIDEMQIGIRGDNDNGAEGVNDDKRGER